LEERNINPISIDWLILARSWWLTKLKKVKGRKIAIGKMERKSCNKRNSKCKSLPNHQKVQLSTPSYNITLTK
jgi:hypothetical protein